MQGQGQPQLDTTMVEFEHLPPPPALDQALLDQINAHITCKNWAMSFQCITMLRSICKFHPEHIANLFAQYGLVVLELFTHGATQLTKNILKLLKEVFQQGGNVCVEGCVAGFLPVLLKRCTTEKGAIREGCQEILTVITLNCAYVTTIEGTAADSQR